MVLQGQPDGHRVGGRGPEAAHSNAASRVERSASLTRSASGYPSIELRIVSQQAGERSGDRVDVPSGDTNMVIEEELCTSERRRAS